MNGSEQVFWTCTGRNKAFSPSTSLPVMGEIIGVNTASLGEYLCSSKTRARWAERFHDEVNSHIVTHHMMKTRNHTIPDRSPLGSIRTAPSTVHHHGGVKHATGASSMIRGRDNITTGTWKAAGILKELIHEMDRYK